MLCGCQFAKFCTERPASLPDMEILMVGADGAAAAAGGKGKGGPSAAPPGLGGAVGADGWRQVDSGSRGGQRADGMRGRGGPPPFDPRAPGNNQYQKGPPSAKGGRKDGKR